MLESIAFNRLYFEKESRHHHHHSLSVENIRYPSSRQILSHMMIVKCLIFIQCFLLHTIVTLSTTSSSFQLFKETKHGIQCLSPSKYYAGACYTYVQATPAPSWDRAYNNCLALPDARLLAIDSVMEYEFIERDLIGLKSGSESVSIYIGLRKMNSTWLWSNDVPLKDTSVYRFWVDNNRDILAYDCGILWLARNTSVITPAPCVEQALRPYVCKQVIDRCYNQSHSCGKYGKCINLPLTNSYQCRCRYFYTGDRCEKWSHQGLQVIICAMIVCIALIILYFIEPSSSNERPVKVKKTSITTKKRPSSLTKRRRWIWIVLPIFLTMMICLITLKSAKFIPERFSQSKELFRFCILYENNYYHHLLTFPMALVIILLIIFYQTRKESRMKWKISIPIPFNPFSKINRFDTMILSAILSHEILEILHELLQIRQSTLHGPLFDLIRQIGLIIIISLRYYPIYSVLELPNGNATYYLLCAFYMWLDLALRIFQQSFCLTKISFRGRITLFDQFGINTSMISVIKYTPYYLCLTYICCRLTYLAIRQISRSFHHRRNSMQKHIYHEPTFSSKETMMTIESQYVQHLFYPLPCKQSFFNRIYQSHPYFHYSKQILNIYIIGWMLIYYLTLNILQNGFHFMEKVYNFTSIPLLILFDELDLPEGKPLHLKYPMIIASLLTAMIYSVQLFFGMKKYQKNMLDAYKGRFVDIPPRSSLARRRFLSKSIHYPGYCIAYLIFGYLIIGNVLFLLLIALNILCRHLFLLEEFSKISIPILAFYLIKLIIQWFLLRIFSLQTNSSEGKTIILKHLRFYFVFTYFNFFFDCFLGIISCLFRLSKAWIVALLYLSRLDYSPLGRPLEKLDPAFIAYASFIHMECLHTHPVLIYFSAIIQEQIQRRQQYARKSKHDMYLYVHHQRIAFRWSLAMTLIRNQRLISMRKSRLKRSNEGLQGKEFPSEMIIENHATMCTTLLLDTDEFLHHQSNSIFKDFSH